MTFSKILKAFRHTLQRGPQYTRYVVAEILTRIIYKPYKFSEFGRIFLNDAKFLRYYDLFVSRDNYRSFDRKYTLDQLMKLVIEVPGDTAECGAYQGASSLLICQRNAGQKKKHHVFDSFEGLSAPSAEDGSYWKKGDLTINEQIIKNRLKPYRSVVFHKGWIPDTFHRVQNETFCFVHIDVDLYLPTLDSLVFFYPKMNAGGIILCDDYGFSTCPGAKKAMDTFFADKNEKIVNLTTGQGLVIKSTDS
jgi:hypothetical protein